jgi:predicted CoA-substrate-specific enzyme activase
MKEYVAGIDAGSNTVKAVILDESLNIVYHIDKTGASSVTKAEETIDSALDKIGRSRKDLQYIVSTGYGRNYISFANKTVTEIHCQARGVYYLFPKARSIIDIGGQDTKVIYLDSQGNVQDFSMNDKCAAGTGRFLEVIASALNLELDLMGTESLKASEEVGISSTCTVFAESEVVSHVARGESLPEIVAGVHRSIIKRILAMALRREMAPQVVITGGVAKNKGVVQMIQDELKQELTIPEEPQITGALGAALTALDNVKS